MMHAIRLHAAARLLTGWLIATIALGHGGAALGDDDATLAQIIGDFERRAEQVQSIRYVLEGEYLTPQGKYNKVAGDMLPPGTEGLVPPEDYTFRQDTTLLADFSENRIRKEQRGESYVIGSGLWTPVYLVELFDGEKMQVYKPRQENGGNGFEPPKYDPELVLQTTGYFSFFPQTADEPMFLAHGSFNLPGNSRNPARLRPSIDPGALTVHGAASHEGRPCVVLRTVSFGTESESFVEYWVDVERQSAVVRYAMYVGGTETRRMEIDYEQTDDGWLPTAWTLLSFYLNGELAAQEKHRVVSREVNPTLSRDAFQIAPTPGMIVADRADDNRMYRVGEPGEPAVDVKVLALQEKETGGSLSIVGWLAIALLCAILISVFLRRRWRVP